MRVLRALNRSPRGKGLAEISGEQGLHKTTALRLLRTLVAVGLLSHDEGSGTYAADPTFWFLVSPFVRPALGLITDVQGILDQMARRERSTAALVMPDECRHRIEIPIHGLPSAPARIEPLHGGAYPLHSTAGGRCYLAYVPKHVLEEYIATQIEGSPRRFREELAAVRRDGYSLNESERFASCMTASVPLWTADGSVCGGLSLTGVGAESEVDRMLARVPALREGAERISSMLSYESFRRYMEGAEEDAPIPPAENAGGADEPGSRGHELTRSVGRAFRLMATLWDLREGATTVELARRRGLDRATTYRLLQSLASEQMVRREARTGRYQIDPILWLRLAPLLQRAASVDRTISVLLERLARVAGATVYLVRSDAGRRKGVLAAYALPQRSLAVHPEPGLFPMLHTIAAGKCLLASQSEAELAAYVRGVLGTATDNTAISPAALAAELRRVRELGYAVSRGEAVHGIGGVAVPIRDSRGEVTAALAVVPLASELSEDRIQRWVEQLQAGARAVSHILGVAQALGRR